MKPSDLYGLTINLSKPVVAAENATATVDTTGAVTGGINGIMVTLAAQTNTALSFVCPCDGTTALTATPLLAQQACIILHCVNTAGAYKNLQGPIGSCDAAGALTGPLHFPNVPNNLMPFGYTEVKCASTGAFTPGTTNWNATGVTSTVADLAFLPGRPLTT